MPDEKNNRGESKMKKGNTKKKIGKKNVKKRANAKKPVKQLISKKMLIGEVAEKYPAVAAILFEYGMHCIGCHINAYESIEQGCSAHGLNAKQVDEIIAKMNKIANKKR